MIAQIQMRRGTTAEWAAASPVVLAEGEPGWDSTLEGMKVGDGSTEWAALPWIDAKNRPDINADKLDGVHLADIRLGQNILHNADFRNPVNQRGVSGAISSGTYFFDRWIRNSGTVTVAAGYLTLASGANIGQPIEGFGLKGETVCVSVKVGTSIYSGTGTFPTSEGSASITLLGFGTAVIGVSLDYSYLTLTASGIQEVAMVKLELGAVSTLAYDPPMDYGVELAKCQRYFVFVGNFPPVYGFSRESGSSGMVYLITAVPMRIKPTISQTTCILYQGGYKLCTITVHEIKGNSIALNVTLTSGTWTTLSVLAGEVDGNVFLSSDL